MQTHERIRIYKEAFRLAGCIFRIMEARKVDHVNPSLVPWIVERADDELLASVSYLCANLAEMGTIDSINAQREKLMCCIGEANETEFWLGTCRSLGLISQQEHLGCMETLMRIRSMLCGLQVAVEAGS